MPDTTYAHVPLLDKLGVKAGQRVSAVGAFEGAFVESLGERVADLTVGGFGAESNVILVRVDDAGELGRVEQALGSMKEDGAIWTVYPKGQKHLTQSHVMAAGRALGLTDCKVCSFSATHTGLKWMIPVADRKNKAVRKK